MKEKSALGYKRGGGLKILLYIFVFPLLLFIVALFLLLVPLPAPFPPPASSPRNLPVAILTGLSGMAFLFWISYYTQSRVRKASHSMDHIFIKSGFQLGKAYGFARTFQGAYHNIIIHGDLFPDYKLQPWRFNISADVSPGFHGVLSNRKPLLTNPNITPLPPHGQLPSVFIYTDQHAQMETILSQSNTLQLIQSIQATLSSSDTWQILLEPQKLQLRVMTYAMHENHVEAWLSTFFQLSEIFKR